MTTLPKEKHDAIIKWAGENAATEEHSFDETRYVGLIDGAHHYATQLHTFQQENERLRNALERLVNVLPKGPNLKYFHAKVEVEAARAVLTAQPEADNQ